MLARSRPFSHLHSLFHLGERSVLDLGCSEGHYLRHFGPGSLGVTIIEEHVKAAEAAGLRVLLGNVEDPTFSPGQKFDVIWANNLFEHLNSPHLFLMKIKDWLKPDGILILGVPVIPYLYPLTILPKFRGAYAVSHVSFFTRKTLIETVRMGGWQVREARLFYFARSRVDAFLNPLAPHIYVVAQPDPKFSYPKKRLLSLQGY